MNIFHAQSSEQFGNLSSLSEQKVKFIIQELCDYFNVKGIPQLAEQLKKTPPAIYRWIDRKSIPGKKLNKKFPELNIHFLETGEGRLIEKPESRYQDSGNMDQLVNRAEELTAEYERQAGALTADQLPPDVAVELVRSSVRLLQRFLDYYDNQKK